MDLAERTQRKGTTALEQTPFKTERLGESLPQGTKAFELSVLGVEKTSRELHQGTKALVTDL